MSFTVYVAIEAVSLEIVLCLLAFYMGRNFLKYKIATKMLDDYEEDYDMARPSDGLPTKAEKRKMKRVRSGMRLARAEEEAILKLLLKLEVAYILFFAWFCFAVHASGGRYASTIIFLVYLVDSFIIFNTMDHNWNR